MTLQYTYKINNLVRDNQDGRVLSAEFFITTTDGVDSFTSKHQIAFPAPKGDMIPFSDLSEEAVVSWLKEFTVTEFSSNKETGDVSVSLFENDAKNEFLAYKLRKSQVAGLPW